MIESKPPPARGCAATKHHVFLVPGFLGFTELGGLSYFRGVAPVLERQFRERGATVEVHQLSTLPTASIRHRAGRVLARMIETTSTCDGVIHLVGHSTGGLDARLAISPSASLPVDSLFERRERVRSLVTVSTPHYGTPLAGAVSGAMGVPLIRLLAILIVRSLRQEHLPIRAAIRLGGWWNRMDDAIGLSDTVLDRLYDDLLHDFDDERREQIVRLIDEVSKDQSALVQLTPAGCDLLNAGTGDPEGVRYGSVVTRARPMSWGSFLAHRQDLYAHLLHIVFRAAYFMTARGADTSYIAPLDFAWDLALRARFGETVDHGDNDGLVPTLSQVWGELVHAASADHLDTVGHFKSAPDALPRADFFPSASGFDEAAFESLWSDVARFMLEST